MSSQTHWSKVQQKAANEVWLEIKKIQCLISPPLFYNFISSLVGSQSAFIRLLKSCSLEDSSWIFDTRCRQLLLFSPPTVSAHISQSAGLFFSLIANFFSITLLSPLSLSASSSFNLFPQLTLEVHSGSASSKLPTWRQSTLKTVSTFLAYPTFFLRLFRLRLGLKFIPQSTESPALICLELIWPSQDDTTPTHSAFCPMVNKRGGAAEADLNSFPSVSLFQSVLVPRQGPTRVRASEWRSNTTITTIGPTAINERWGKLDS